MEKFWQRKVMKFVVAPAVGVFALTGCAAESELDVNKSATIIAHEYDDSDVVAIKPLIIDAEHFNLIVQQCGIENPDDNSDTGQNTANCFVETVEVSESYYDAHADGEVLRGNQVQELLDSN